MTVPTLPEAALLWRLGVVVVALALVVAGLIGLVGLARAEWRRDHPGSRRYLGVVARFLLAFVLVLVATA